MTLYSPGGLNLADTTAPLILAYNDSGTKDVVFAVSATGDLTITPDGGDITLAAALAVTSAVFDQLTADTAILDLRSTGDIATGLTTATALPVITTSYGVFGKLNATQGGLRIQSMVEDEPLATSFILTSYGGTATTTKSSAGRSLIEFHAAEHDGANTLTNIAANGNVFGIRAYVGGAFSTLWILDEDGDTWQEGDATIGGALTVTGGFGCNGQAAQTAYASGGALAAYVTGAFGLNSDANMEALYDLVVAIRAALVADGVMS